MVSIISVLVWKYSFWQVWSKQWKLSVLAEICYLVQLKYEKFNVDVHSYYFWTEFSFLWQIYFKKPRLFVEAEISNSMAILILFFFALKVPFFGLIWSKDLVSLS